MLGGLFALALVSTKICGVSGPQLNTDRRAVQDRSRAIHIAYDAAARVYGGKIIDDEKPLTALKIGSVWKVEGTLPAGYVGGVVEVTLAALDGAITEICHGK